MESRRRSNAVAATAEPKQAEGQVAVLRQRETAEYLADMILELRNLARVSKLHTVMVPLEFAYYEAFGAANRVEVPQSEIERIKELSKVSEELEAQGPPLAG